MDVTSVFGSKLLVTRNWASAPFPPEFLSHDLRGTAVDKLVTEHRNALTLLAPRGLTPDGLDPTGLLDFSSTSRGGAASGPSAAATGSHGRCWRPAKARARSTRRRRAAGRIEAWLTAQSPAS